jgi:CheY-like chemotaxis protein
MAGAIAHHFNNQLQAVTMSLELAMNDLPPNAGPVERLTEAMQSARKAAEVSSLMLTYLGQTVAKREPLDLSEVCHQSLSLLSIVRPQSGALETDLLTPGPTINANANQIQQVLTNLVTNAWEASGDGRGAIRLTVKTVSAADIPAVNRFPIDYQPQENAYACLEVADAGCGIPGKDIEKLFDPFFSSKFIGRGLGLPVVLGIVRAHCGAITVESEPGRGSVFRVFLPVSAEAVPQKPVPVAQALKTAGGGLSACHAQAGTVLVVEDEPAVRKMVTLALKRLGFTVLAAEDGLEAVAVFRQHRDEIGCVLCDLTMPRMNGWETLTALRKLAPGIPVILSSGYSEAQVMEGHHPELPQAFLSKPYEHKALINAISQVLANRKG